jgi:methylated-DNA-[protein]-cysteine S-methyltransferase
MKYSILKFDFMYVWFFWESNSGLQIKSISMSMKKPALKGEKSTTSESEKVKDLICRYLDGNLKKLPINRLDMSGLSPFAKTVLCELRKSVKRGNAVSYGRLAELAGNPGAARAVGSVMRNNPFPLFFPCHRVIKSNGELGFFQGSSAGTELKRLLLNQEGMDLKCLHLTHVLHHTLS